MAEEFDSIVAVLRCEVRWGDCDPAGIIFYPTYFRWMDAAAWALWDSVGYSAKRMKAEHRAMPLVSAECRFIAPAQQGDRCEVRSRIAPFGRKRLAWLSGFLDLPHGIPSHDTLERVFDRLKPRAFQACFREWVQAVRSALRIKHIAMDA